MVKIGLEMHQQLDTGKLFCRCPVHLSDDYDLEFMRTLRPVVSELGKVDRAVLQESRKSKTLKYYANTKHTCAIEWDEEPPLIADKKAITIATQISKLLHAHLLDEVQIMRKILIDGSAVTGFQRTALIATHGNIDGIGISTISVEEDSSRPFKDGFNLDRLGVPLIEVATEPQITSGEEAKRVAKKLGTLFRMAKVKRGLGTIRQDLNISIPAGRRVEVKGVQDLDLIPKLVEFEVERQKSIVKLKGKLSVKFSKIEDVSELFLNSTNKILAKKPVYAAIVEGASGLFATNLHQGKHLGRELAEYVKSYGFGGYLHSDEKSPVKELKKIKIKLKAKANDLIVLSAGSKEPLKLIKERLNQLSGGVTEDTRRANIDASTSYLRPLPTGARMYPETDILPFTLPDVKDLEKPEVRRERLEKILPKEIAKKLFLSSDYYLFEKLGGEPVLGMIITEILPSLRRQGLDVKEIHILEVLKLHKLGKLPKDGILHGLETLSSGKTLETDADLLEVKRFIKTLVSEKKEYILDNPNASRGLMGQVMGKYRGKVSGKLIMELIEGEIKRSGKIPQAGKKSKQ
ncbi:MAG: Glu-tRNA(Gln) amidotransferase subunit GatE [Candidatus Altiarchaeota archaeon]|nr:Glu-tRNA(Gln) amidotransferase subunit GatE [Candidatus Altiarchaeota archaeon]